MLGCICKELLREEDLAQLQMEKLEIRAVIKYLCKRGMPPREIHEDFMETLGKESTCTSNRTEKKWVAEFKRGRVLRMMDGLAAPKMPRQGHAHPGNV